MLLSDISYLFLPGPLFQLSFKLLFLLLLYIHIDIYIPRTYRVQLTSHLNKQPHTHPYAIMFLKSTLLAGLSLLTLTSAHFRITYPADRGESEGDESKDPCGGASVSSERTPWPISGGRVSFEAGHDEAETHVLLYVGENPTKNDDFNITLAPAFNQIGLGNFCWEKVGVPKGAAEIKNGTKATIQMRQYGDEKTWLYNVCVSPFHPVLHIQMRANGNEDPVRRHHIRLQPAHALLQMRKRHRHHRRAPLGWLQQRQRQQHRWW